MLYDLLSTCEQVESAAASRLVSTECCGHACSAAHRSAGRAADADEAPVGDVMRAGRRARVRRAVRCGRDMSVASTRLANLISWDIRETFPNRRAVNNRKRWNRFAPRDLHVFLISSVLLLLLYIQYCSISQPTESRPAESGMPLAADGCKRGQSRDGPLSITVFNNRKSIWIEILASEAVSILTQIRSRTLASVHSISHLRWKSEKSGEYNSVRKNLYIQVYYLLLQLSRSAIVRQVCSDSVRRLWAKQVLLYFTVNLIFEL